MTREAASFKKVFHWTQIFSFWNLKISFIEIFHESLKNSLIGIQC